MLKALLDFESGLTRLGKEFAPRRIVWLINFNAQGEFVGLNNALGPEGKGKEYPNCPFAGTATRGKAASFLFDKWEVVLALGKDGKPAESRRDKQRYFLDLLRQASDSHPDIRLVAEALSTVDESGEVQPRTEVMQRIKDAFATLARAGKKNPDAALPAGETVSFSVDLRAILDQTGWHTWWKTRRGATPVTATGGRRRCVATGELVEPAERHELTIEGLKKYGGRGQDSLAAFDKGAFQSYGLPFAENAAMSADTASRYVTALNVLIKNHSVDLDDSLAVYWFDKPLRSAEEDPIAHALDRMGAGENGFDGGHAARTILEAVREGERATPLRNSYHTLLLSGYSGRVMVRSYTTGPLKELANSVSTWFEHLQIVALAGDGNVARTYGLRMLLLSLLPEMKPGQSRENWLKPLGGLSPYFWNCASSERTKFPARVLGLVVPLIRQQWLDLAEAEKPANRNSKDSAKLYSLIYRRMGLLKAFHIRNLGDTAMKPHLNQEHPSPAYHCGRWLALLANLQRTALGDVGAGVVQRNYGAVSQAPALHLGRLVSNAKNHLNKLDPGLAYWFEDQFAEVATRVGDRAPRTLTLEEQSLFALGYYQQLAQLRARKTEKAAKDAAVETEST